MVPRGRKLKTQTVDPQMEIQVGLWEALPENLVLSILAMLPVRTLARMRIVCKRWNSLLSPGDALQRIDPIFSVNSIPGFLIQLGRDPRDLQTWVIELGHSGSDVNIYKSPLPNDQIVVDACQSICCCHRRGDMDLSIGNPATRTWRRLPRPAHVNPDWDFIGMTFDSTSRRCTILLGENNADRSQSGSGNSMVLETYDSESNAWTGVSREAPIFIQPHGKGLYSKGNFYWIIKGNFIYFMVAFAIAEKSWTEITLPEGCRKVCCKPSSLYLSGCHGRVVLIQKGEKLACMRMWRLNEGQGAAEWCELHAIWGPNRNRFYSVVENSGWAMMVDRGKQIYVCNPERKLTKKFSLRERLGRSEELFIQFQSAFESNNVWWP